ncbi:MAG: hypothetical protein QNJ33_02230 [Crocosphaera sp.]|nr:hypothetical protein [Crocosphaera sp.]
MNQDKSYLLDIAKLCRTILRLTDGMTQTDFYFDERTQLAVLYEITIIGEVVKRLSHDFRQSHPDIQCFLNTGGLLDTGASVNVLPLLGRVNFFQTFDVCFYGSQFMFELLLS